MGLSQNGDIYTYIYILPKAGYLEQGKIMRTLGWLKQI
jgi:hypothetical protein